MKVIEEATNWQELSAEANRDRRREKRIPLVFPIEVSGFDRFGRYFSQRTKTADVSQSGCCFSLKVEVERGVVVAIKLVSRQAGRGVTDKPLLFQVARTVREASGWTVGAVKLQPESLWCVAFPSTSEQTTPVA